MNNKSLIREATKQLSADSPFTANHASLYGVTADGASVSLGYAPDIYDLLETATSSVPLIGLVIHTTGWASPISESTAPSQHPERQRVSLCAGVSLEGMFSVIRFQEKPDETVEDEGNAGGYLAEALSDTLARLTA